MNNKLKKCKELINGLKQTIPNDNISQNYIKQAEKTLESIEELIKKEDFLWSSVMIYYSTYYSLYAFLQKLGIKSENHNCSIEFFLYITKNQDLYNKVTKLKKSRIDSQYYLNILSKEEISQNFIEAKEFYLEIVELLKIDSEKKDRYQKEITQFFKSKNRNVKLQ